MTEHSTKFQSYYNAITNLNFADLLAEILNNNFSINFYHYQIHNPHPTVKRNKNNFLC